jgi:hypothetical protein
MMLAQRLPGRFERSGARRVNALRGIEIDRASRCLRRSIGLAAGRGRPNFILQSPSAMIRAHKFPGERRQRRGRRLHCSLVRRSSRCA